MHADVCLLGRTEDYAEGLCRSLTDQGYLLNQSGPAYDLQHTNARPTIYLVDITHFPESSGRTWEAFVATCLEQEAICLAYASNGRTDPSAISPLQPIADFLDYPLDSRQVLAKIQTLLTMHKLMTERDRARALADKRQRELQDALQSAAQVQRRLIPTEHPDGETLKYAWHFMPCKRVGGDLFNVTRLDEETVMVYLLDVSGHGISSAMVSVAVHQSLSPHTGQLPKRQTSVPPFYAITPPAMVMQRLEEEYPFERFEEFFSLVYLLISPGLEKIRYCCAGHPPPLLLRRDGGVERLDRGGTIIGLGHLLEFEEGEVVLGAGDRLFLYTDGVTEHGPPGGGAFGETRLTRALRQARDRPLEDTVNSLINETLRAFGGEQPFQDDVTLIGIEAVPKQRPSTQAAKGQRPDQYHRPNRARVAGGARS